MKKLLALVPMIVLFSACSAQTPAPTPSPAGSNSVSSPSPTSTTDNGSPAITATYTMADVQQHASASDCWTVIGTDVYNVTSFIPNHPGGDEIEKACGRDATRMFGNQPQHAGADAMAVLPTLKIGTLKQ